MDYPPLVEYKTLDEYRTHYKRVYCRKPISTFDGIKVRFRKSRFSHSFFESSKRNQVKDQFSKPRAVRIDWIRAALQDPDAELYVGWDRKRRRYVTDHRVTVVVQNYVVIIRLSSPQKAQFVTAYIADSDSTISRIRKSPKWSAQKT